MTNLIGQSLGRYHILEQLGEGGMATVYKAYDTRLETDVAVKVIRTENILPSVLERSLKRFEREAKSLARLTHPNIVKVTDYGEFEGKPYLVMPYLPGGTLKERIKQGPIPWQEAVRLLLPIAQALEYAHEQSIIHRDVKPSNILLTSKGQPMLTDFGVAKLFNMEETADLTGTGMGVGTPEYMAPEQWQGQVSVQTDVYALGVVLYEMVTGRRPYTADTPAALLIKQTNDPLPRPGSFAPGLPDEVEKVLLKMLAKRMEDRFRDMTMVVSVMLSLTGIQGKTVDATVTDSYTLADTNAAKERKDSLKTTRNSRGKWIVLGGALAVLLLICGVLIFAGASLTGLLSAANTPFVVILPSSTSPVISTPTILYTDQPTSLSTTTIQQPTSILQASPTSTLPPSSACNSAQFITDVTILDGTTMTPGQTFVKVWRIKNIGSCAWTNLYSLVFIDGDRMGAVESVPIPGTVNPGQTVDISINFIAPTSPGSYRSNWMFRDPTGGYFSTNNYGRPFWVQIRVVGSSTPSP